MVTNLTVVNQEFLKKLSSIKWKALHLAFSIDGVKTLQEYIGYPLKWESFDRNLRKLLEFSKGFHCSTSITVNAYNVFRLAEIFDYIESFREIKKIAILFSFLVGPDFLRTDVLPKEIKEQAIIKLIDYKKRSVSINSKLDLFNLENSLDVIIERLKHESDDVLERRKEFVKFTKALDKFNGHNILDVCPELAPLFDNSYN